eukprot:gene10175-11259_t
MKVTELLHLLVILACSQSVVWTDRLSFKNLPPLRCQRPLAALAASVLLCAAPALAQQQLDSIPCATTSVVIAEEPNRKLSDLDSLLSGLLGGAASRASKEVVLHPIDTVKARVQTAQGAVNGSFLSLYGDPALYEKLYDGLIPSLLGGIPAGAVFFGVKDFSKSFLSGALPSWSRPEITALAVVLANVPYWLLRTPSEVVKTQQQVKGRSSSAGGVNKNDVSAWATTLRDGPLMAQAFSSNLLYALPADIIKFVIYEQFVGNGRVEGLQAAFFGAIASALAQLLTTPLDVLRVRVMLGSSQSGQSGRGIVSVSSLLAAEGPAVLFLGTAPRLLRAVVSGGVQFASYELARNILTS